MRRPESGWILVGRDAAREGKEGEPSRAGLAARSLAVGPKAQEGVREPATGQNRKRAASTEKKISSFLILEAFLDIFFIVVLITIQFCTNVYIV